MAAQEWERRNAPYWLARGEDGTLVDYTESEKAYVVVGLGPDDPREGVSPQWATTERWVVDIPEDGDFDAVVNAAVKGTDRDR